MQRSGVGIHVRVDGLDKVSQGEWETVNKWIPAKTTADGWTVLDSRIDRKMSILVTYKTVTGRRYVKQVEVGLNGSVGYISKKLNGRITAWMPLPMPYEGE